jgi:hypothetical protein
MRRIEVPTDLPHNFFDGIKPGFIVISDFYAFPLIESAQIIIFLRICERKTKLLTEVGKLILQEVAQAVSRKFEKAKPYVVGKD